MEIHQLRYAVAAGKYLNFTKAADSLHFIMKKSYNRDLPSAFLICAPRTHGNLREAVVPRPALRA